MLHNAIHPHHPLADLAASVALDIINPADRPDFHINIAAGTSIELSDTNAVEIDDEGQVIKITVTQSSWLGPSRDGAVIDFAAGVRRHGQCIGYTTAEPYCVVREDRLISLSGRDRMTIGVRVLDGTADE